MHPTQDLSPSKFWQAVLVDGYASLYADLRFAGVQYAPRAPNTYAQPTQSSAACHACSEQGMPDFFRILICSSTYFALFTVCHPFLLLSDRRSESCRILLQRQMRYILKSRTASDHLHFCYAMQLIILVSCNNQRATNAPQLVLRLILQRLLLQVSPSRHSMISGRMQSNLNHHSPRAIQRP